MPICLSGLPSGFWLLRPFSCTSSSGRDAGPWSNRRFPCNGPTYGQYLSAVELVTSLPWGHGNAAGTELAWGSLRTVVHDFSGFFVFSNSIVFTIFATFLLPLWSLSFATEGLGREREARNLLWVLTRPLSRPAIYLAKYLALLPWCLLLNLGGFALLCLLAKTPGAWRWRCIGRRFSGRRWLLPPSSTSWGPVCSCAPVVAILYSFFLETIAGNLPGHLKRLSISFYTLLSHVRGAHTFGLQPERPTIYLPVSGTFALSVLVALTIVLLLAGMIVFARKEIVDAT